SSRRKRTATPPQSTSVRLGPAISTPYRWPLPEAAPPPQPCMARRNRPSSALQPSEGRQCLRALREENDHGIHKPRQGKSRGTGLGNERRPAGRHSHAGKRSAPAESVRDEGGRGRRVG